MQQRQIFSNTDMITHDIYFRHEDLDEENVKRDFTDDSYESITDGPTEMRDLDTIARTILLVRDDINYVAITMTYWDLDENGELYRKETLILDELWTTDPDIKLNLDDKDDTGYQA